MSWEKSETELKLSTAFSYFLQRSKYIHTSFKVNDDLPLCKAFLEKLYAEGKAYLTNSQGEYSNTVPLKHGDQLTVYCDQDEIFTFLELRQKEERETFEKRQEEAYSKIKDKGLTLDEIDEHLRRAESNYNPYIMTGKKLPTTNYFYIPKELRSTE